MIPVRTFCWRQRSWVWNQKNEQHTHRTTTTVDKPKSQASSSRVRTFCWKQRTWVWNQKNQQQAQPTTTTVRDISQTSATTHEACPFFASPSNPSLPATTTPAPSSSETANFHSVAQGEKRKEPEGEPEITASTSQPTKRFKPSETIIDCETALSVLRGLNYFAHGFLNSGKVLAWALSPDDGDFLRIQKYFINGQDPTETPMKILSILRIITSADKLENGTPLDFPSHPNASEMLRKMLWYGTWRWNVSSILENGFRMPFPNPGIYFSDIVAQSRRYCGSGIFSSTGYLFLADVLLGKKGQWNESNDNPIISTTSAVGDIECASRKLAGLMIPNKEFDVEVDGCVWPLGRTTRNMSMEDAGWEDSCLYNEYIVYNSLQALPKFLLKVEL